MNISRVLRHFSALGFALLLASCASSTPRANVISPLSAAITQQDQVSTVVTSSDGRMPESDNQMLADTITQKVQSMAQPGMGSGHTYELAVNITRYSRGNNIVRTLTPGMGQMRMEGVVTVYQMPKRVPVGEFAVSKSFMIGGLYGISVSMNTIANAYAQAVAETVCQSR